MTKEELKILMANNLMLKSILMYLLGKEDGIKQIHSIIGQIDEVFEKNKGDNVEEGQMSIDDYEEDNNGSNS